MNQCAGKKKRNNHKPKKSENKTISTVAPPKGHVLEQVNPSSGCYSLERCGIKPKAKGLNMQDGEYNRNPPHIHITLGPQTGIYSERKKTLPWFLQL